MLDWKFSSKSHIALFQGSPTLFSVRKGERRWEGGVGGMCLHHNTPLVNSLTSNNSLPWWLCDTEILSYIVLIVFHHRSRTLEDTRGDRDIEKLMMKSSEEEFRAKTDPTLLLSREVGNMYTASLYSGVASLLAM